MRDKQKGKEGEEKEKKEEEEDIFRRLHRVPLARRWREGLHTLTGGPGHLELGEEPPELLPDGGGPQQTLVVEEVLVAPLGALLVLQGEKAAEKCSIRWVNIRLQQVHAEQCHHHRQGTLP